MATPVSVAHPPPPLPAQQSQQPQPRRSTKDVQQDQEQAHMRDLLRRAQARQEQKQQKKNKMKAPPVAAAPVAAAVAVAPAETGRPTPIAPPPPVRASPQSLHPSSPANNNATVPLLQPPPHYDALSQGTNGLTNGTTTTSHRASYDTSPPGRPVPPPRSNTRGEGGLGTFETVDPVVGSPLAAPTLAGRANGPDPPVPSEAEVEEEPNATSLSPAINNRYDVPVDGVYEGRQPRVASQPEGRSWLGTVHAVMVLVLAVYMLTWRPATRTTTTTTTTAPRELPGRHSQQAGKGAPQPCFQTFPIPEDTEDDYTNWDPRCPKYRPEQLLPCPPRAVCQGGQVVACESYLWIPSDGPANIDNSGVVSSSDSTASLLWSSVVKLFHRLADPVSTAATAKTRPEWPTRCVLSEQADVLLSSVVSILEAWTIRTVCPLTDTGGSGVPQASVSDDHDDGDEPSKHPRFMYGDVFAELERRASDEDWLQDMLVPDAEIFQELAEGRLELRWGPTAISAACSNSATTTTDDSKDEDPALNDSACLAAVTSPTTLWIGLISQHPLRLPPSCLVGKGLAGLMQFGVKLVLQTVWFLILLPFFRSSYFLFNVVLVFFREMPLVYSVATSVGLLVTVVKATQMWIRRQDRQKQQRFRETRDHIKNVAVDILKGEGDPLSVLALRDAVREKMGSAAAPKGTFNKVVWPAAQLELERDRRVAVHMRQGGEKALLWIGPRAN